MKTNADTPEISSDLSWVDMLKGIAIIGVFFDNWMGYMQLRTSPVLLYSLVKVFALGVGPFVQVFFILSGFGLSITYFEQDKANWSWKRWAWRRITKIVVPYLIAVVFSFVIGILGSYLYTSIDVKFSWVSFISYLIFAQNVCKASWGWNEPLWFMPVIIGLYFSFPVLNKILEKLGMLAMLLISAFVTYGTLTIVALATAFRGEHASDLFTFWMIQFALGIALAYMRKTNPPKLRVLIGVKPFFIGAGLLMCSWALRTYVPLGKVFNDPITSIGIFLLLLNLVWTFRKVRGTAKILISLSNKSYLMYLIHYPIMKFLIGPPLRGFTNPLIVVALGSLYVLAIFSVCSLISKPINGISSWIYYKDQA